jgi:hypothetical protein
MSSAKSPFPDDQTAAERCKHLTEPEIEDLKLAGGIEGGMQAGEAGPRAADSAETKQKGSDPKKL